MSENIIFHPCVTFFFFKLPRKLSTENYVILPSILKMNSFKPLRMPKTNINPAAIKIEDFQYELPDERIARFPLEKRDQSKLLIYKGGRIEADVFRKVSTHLPENALLLLNQAKVVHARLHFRKSTGGKIEIFCLEPDSRYLDITTAMMQKNEVYWNCILRGASKWKDDSPLELKVNYSTTSGEKTIKAEARKVSREGQSFNIHFKWETGNNEQISFSEFLEHAGKIPIPPYLKRKAKESDEERYQTIFAKSEGSVAAPTAALHFTSEILNQLPSKNIDLGELTLHVSAGTFMPVKSKTIAGHEMHAEWIEISLGSLEKIAQQLQTENKIIGIGTTSARTLESLYWIGVQILKKQWQIDQKIAVSQWYPYQEESNFTGLQAINALIDYYVTNNLQTLITQTKLIIVPGYEFRLLDGLITNFHQPSSTLLLMISAFVGEDWKKIYDYALDNNFRFLSYGDGSLLWR